MGLLVVVVVVIVVVFGVAGVCSRRGMKAPSMQLIFRGVRDTF